MPCSGKVSVRRAQRAGPPQCRYRLQRDVLRVFALDAFEGAAIKTQAGGFDPYQNHGRLAVGAGTRLNCRGRREFAELKSGHALPSRNGGSSLAITERAGGDKTDLIIRCPVPLINIAQFTKIS